MVFPIWRKVCDTSRQFVLPTRETTDPMTKSRILVAALLVYLAAPVAAQTPLGLMFNGEIVVPKGQLKNFSYEPMTRSLTIETFFGDVRCAPGTQSGTGTPITVLIDKFSDLEAASYKVFSGGNIEYNLSDGLVKVTTADQTSNGGCTHQLEAVGVILSDPGLVGEADPGTFWASDFSGPIRVISESSGTVSVGGTLVVEFELTNVSKVLVATDLRLGLDTTYPSTVGAPTFALINPEPGESISNGSWSLPILWPGETRRLEVRYDLQNAVGDETIRTEVANAQANNRTRNAPLALGNVSAAVVNTTAP
ncbi:MAG: hypothetical protein RQ847_05555 [Wenzhouxiangellaceae bacterium]|nr:hypothetical protein [Wenzhouxiangellaceae bacterium]